MTQRSVSLALAFLKTRPQAAATVLEQYDIRKVADFLSDIPPSHATPVLQYMLPTFSARVCALLNTQQVAGLLIDLDVNLVAAVLRCIDKRQQTAILEEFPTKTRLICNLLLSYPDDTVGAWMTPHVVTVTDDSLVGDALQAVRTADSSVHTDHIFVVDRELTLKGRIHYSSLLRAAPETAVNILVTDAPPTLSGRTLIARAGQNGGWESHEAMPVLNRKRQFVGALRHVELRKALANTVEDVQREPAEDTFSGFCETYSQTLLALFHTAGDLFGSGSPKKGTTK